ncbi:MAG: FHA domain-containing protein [Planctomycetaceae bacterium]|nr:FHA domain-containing protein [Planctomycetaceae bacterium]
MPKTIKLAIYFNDELRAVKELALPFVIGRSHDANLTIPHPMVSRRHCLIFDDKGVVRLQDLGSLNGTWVGKERIMELVFEDGSEFLIGNIRFVFNPDDTVKMPAFPVAPDSDIVKANDVLSLSDELTPPLPPPASQPTMSRPAAPNFIKPLSFPTDDGESGILKLNDVIDLADVIDKEASTPPSLREEK